jgi:cytochrome c-type biogenesis protein CcmE
MSHKAAKIGLTGVVLAVAFGALLYSTLGESAQYYKHVEEVMVQPEAWYGRPLQIHGYARDIRRKRDSLDYSFEMHSKGQVVRATYTGIVPDTFKDGAEIVLTGQLGPQGFHATDMTAKCPSKYEAAGPPAPTVR